MATQSITDKRKEVKNGLVYAELKNFFSKQLKGDPRADEKDKSVGFGGVEICRAPRGTNITLYATDKNKLLGERNQRINTLQELVKKRFGGWLGNNVDLAAALVGTRGLEASIQCESLAYKLIGGLAVRRACYGVLRFVMESGADGVEIVVAGKLRGQRAKSMKFVSGKMIHSGDPTNIYVKDAVRHIKMKQGVLGVKVKILLKFDPNGVKGPNVLLPDTIQVEPVREKKEKELTISMTKKLPEVPNPYAQQQPLMAPPQAY